MIRSKTRIELLNENFLNFIMTSVYFWGNSLSLIGKSQVQVCVNFKVPCYLSFSFSQEGNFDILWATKTFTIPFPNSFQTHYVTVYTCTCTDVLIFFLIFHYSFLLLKSLKLKRLKSKSLNSNFFFQNATSYPKYQE